jgi:hypothetical protein
MADDPNPIVVLGIGLTRQLGYNLNANSVASREEAMAKKTAKKTKKKAKTFTATGKTLDEAVEKAHALIPPNPRISDEIIKSKIVSAGRRTGGIAAFRDFFAEVEQIEKQ